MFHDLSAFKQWKQSMPKKFCQLSKKVSFQIKNPAKLGVEKGTESGGTFGKICSGENIAVWSTISETKAAFAERAIQSLKHLIYRYIGDHGEKTLPKLQQLVSTMNCRKHQPIGKSPSYVKKDDFNQICIKKKLFIKLIQPNFKIGPTKNHKKKR